MNHELVTAAQAFGAFTHVNAFGDPVPPANGAQGGLMYRRNDLEIAIELLRKMPAGSIRITCGKNMKFAVMLDDKTSLGEYPDLARAAIALVELMNTLDSRDKVASLPKTACA